MIRVRGPKIAPSFDQPTAVVTPAYLPGLRQSQPTPRICQGISFRLQPHGSVFTTIQFSVLMYQKGESHED